ncbi:lamin tail domain-containing protein [Mucisphaera sp.]|uniref:lamin tail domain-containing protein n=1 Tax=Mucisphaera sp. TaxID=2913024 RepID=UPI003D11554C
MRTALTLAAALAMTSTASAGLIISEVVDGTRGGGNPKFVEITNTGSTDITFASGGIINQSNANTDLDIDVDLTGVTIFAGQSFVIQSSSNGGQGVFEDTYGFAADLYTPAFFSNGDDRYILNLDGVIVDIHGQIDTDGTGEAWEYTDSYAFRLPTAISGNNGNFDISEWFHAGVNGLEDANFDDAAEKVLLLELTTPGTHEFVIPEPASAALLGLGVLALARRSA